MNCFTSSSYLAAVCRLVNPVPVLLLLLLSNSLVAQNLVTNGDFESTGGFISDYTYTIGPGSPPVSYSITNNPGPINPRWCDTCRDHTTGNGKMMVIDGGNAPTARIWESAPTAGIPVIPGKTYVFSFWMQGITVLNTIPKIPHVEVTINGERQYLTNGWVFVPYYVGEWGQWEFTWTATTTNARIAIYNTNTEISGNDFALDDIQFYKVPPLRLTSSIKKLVCPSANDAAITLYGIGGTPPYMFSFNGGSFSTNNLLTGLTAGSYSVAVRDAANDTLTAGVRIDSPSSPINIIGDQMLCIGDSTTLTAYNGNGIYNWAASPPDPSLVTPNIQNPTVSPSQTTTYTVTSSILPGDSTDLVYNGDFSAGNDGFYTDYYKLADNPFTVINQSYNVSSYPFVPTNCSPDWQAGQMMIVKGSINPNIVVWRQRMPVTPHTTYVFKYLLKGLDLLNVCAIETQVDAAPITGISTTSTASPDVLCEWKEVSYNWNSGTDTSAEITLFNRQLNDDGNSFALDNISFKSPSTSCSAATKSITVQVGTLPAPNITYTAVPICTAPTGSFRIIPTDTGSFTFSIDGTNYSNTSGIFTGVPSGIYPATYRKNSGCTSNITNVWLTNVSPAPDTPRLQVYQPSCERRTGMAQVLTPLGSDYYYSKDGVNYTNSSTFTLLMPGTYSITVKKGYGGCPSPPALFTIDTIPFIPTYSSATAFPAGCFEKVVAGGPTGPNYYYTLQSFYHTYASPTGQFNQVHIPGNYSLTLHYNVNGCQSTPISFQFTRGAEIPLATVTQPTCFTGAGTITVTYPTVTTGLTFSIDGINYTSSTVFNNVQPGAYELRSKTAAGCISDSIIIKVDSLPGPPENPNAAIFKYPTCTDPTGTIVIYSPTAAGNTYSLDGVDYSDETGVFYNVPPGNYNITVRNKYGCVSGTYVLTVPYPANTPAAPVITVTQPGCTTPTGTITISPPSGANVTYSIDGTNYTNTTGVFTGLAAGTYNVTYKNDSGCISQPAIAFIGNQPSTPTAPNLSVTQPDCKTRTGTITITGPVGRQFSYSINGSVFDPSGIFSGLNPGTYTVTVKNDSGCISTGTTTTITAPPTLQPPVILVAQPDCVTSTGILTVSSPLGSRYTYSIDGINYNNTTGVFQGLLAGNYSVTVRDSSGCTSSATIVIVNAPPPIPPAPVVSVIQADCITSTGTITVTTPTGTGLTYSIDGTNYLNTTGIFNLLSAGTYNITVRNANGCTSLATSVTLNPAVSIPAPIVSVVQPDCITNTGKITITNASAGQFYSINGSDYSNTDGLFQNIAPGVYNVTAKNTTGCISSATQVILNAPIPLGLSLTATPNPAMQGSPVLLQVKGDRPFAVLSWSPATSFPNQTATSQNIIVNNSQSYNVIGETDDGCGDTASVTVFVNAIDAVFMPNTFTPNNDGKNDILYVYGNTIEKMELKIFNPEGGLLFQSGDKSVGWDGTAKGKRQPSGVYIYVLYARLTNGTEINKKGTINLFR